MMRMVSRRSREITAPTVTVPEPRPVSRVWQTAAEVTGFIAVTVAAVGVWEVWP